MLRFCKISRLVVFCAVAMLVAPAVAHAQSPQITFTFNGLTNIIPGSNGMVTFSGNPFDPKQFPGSTCTFTVNLTAQSKLTNGILKLGFTTFSVKGGDGQTIEIQLTVINNTLTAMGSLESEILGTITGTNSVAIFQAILMTHQGEITKTDTVPLGTFGKPDAPISGSGSVPVTNTGSQSMTLASQITGGDVTLTEFSAKDGD